MSVTFSPVINWTKINDQSTDFNARYIQHCNWNDVPEKLKMLREKSYVDGDIAYFLYEEGAKPLQVWQKWLQKHDMILYEDYPFKKVYVDDPKYKVVIVLYADPKEHRGKEMTLSNDNAYALLQFLKLPESGNMNPIAFLKTIQNANQNKLSKFTRPFVDEQYNDPTAPLGLGQGARMIDYGLDENKIKQYLMYIEEICDHCIKYECNIGWG